jgi:hypothetical protein
MRVEQHRAVEGELQALPPRELHAMENALEKLEQFGDLLPFPHSSRVQGAQRLWELRPRSGSSPWRAFYRRIGDAMVIGAIGPEAEQDPRGFRRSVASAEDRLATIEEERKRS